MFDPDRFNVELFCQPVANGTYPEGLGGIVAAKKAVNAMIASRMIRLVNRFSGYKAVRASINGGVQLATTPPGYNSDSTDFSISKRPNERLSTARASEPPSHRTNISSFLETREHANLAKGAVDCRPKQLRQ
jgi:hypothetical protein